MEAKNPRILLVGATGFVGGSILSSLLDAHPEAHVYTLVRKEADGTELKSTFPNLEPVIGSLSDISLLTSTAANVDFVIHAAGDDLPAMKAMIDGLALNTTGTPAMPQLISISGTRSLIDTSLPVSGTANLEEQPWSDTTDARTILSLPHSRWHTEAYQATLAYGAAKGVGAIIVAPGQLWGRGTGHFKKEGKVASSYYDAVKRRGRAFVIGDGSATWSWLSIRDMSCAVVHLVEESLMRGEEARKRVGVNHDGYYFVQSRDVSMMERAQAISARLGLGEVERIAVDAATALHPLGPLMWGCGARFRADKLRELGWLPKELDWRVLMEEQGGNRA